eukprot:COSAG04_NODE_12941_length_627_cov_1.113636_1_plen_199_part_01
MAVQVAHPSHRAAQARRRIPPGFKATNHAAKKKPEPTHGQARRFALPVERTYQKDRRRRLRQGREASARRIQRHARGWVARLRVARWHAAASVMQRRWRQRAAAFEQALVEKEWNALKRAEEAEAAAAARAEAERRASRDAFEAWAPYVNVELIMGEERAVECLHVVATVISAAARGHAARRAVRQEHRWSLRERREEA